MNVEYMKYLLSIIHFLQTVTIKFEPFVRFLNDKYRDTLPVKDEIYVSRPEHKDEQVDITTFPYYINLMGEYHKYNKPVYITDINGNDMLLNRINMDQHPELRAYYSTDFGKLNKLYYKYPQSIEIIKCSLYPISCDTYEELHNAPDLSLLGYGKGILDENEEHDIVAFLRLFLDYVSNRWYVKEFEEFEDMYPHAWWSTLWFLLFIGIMTKRILNIKTSFVNDYHIVEYLYSKGFERCRYCFDDYIRKFLYKNYRYLENLKGQNTILEILDKYILSHFGFKIFKYRIQKHTYNRQNHADWEPEVLLTDIYDKPAGTVLKFDELLYELYSKQRIKHYDPYSNEKIYNNIKFNKYNEILTKYLSLSQHNLNIYYDRFVFPLVFDFVVDMMSRNKISYLYDINNILPTETYGTTVGLVFPVELLYIYSYCMYKLTGIDPAEYKLPESYHGLVIAEQDNINPEFYVNNQRFNIDFMTNVNEVKNQIYPIPYVFTDKQGLTEYISKIFNNIIESVIIIRTTGDLLTCEAYLHMLKQMFPKKVITLPKPYVNIETFADYFNIRPDLREMFITFTKDDYMALANNILATLVNIDRKFSSFISTPKILIDENCLYTIFDKLSSYNVNYLTGTFYDAIIVDNILIRSGTIYTDNYQGQLYVNDRAIDARNINTLVDVSYPVSIGIRSDMKKHLLNRYEKLEIGPLVISRSQTLVYKTISVQTGLNMVLLEN